MADVFIILALVLANGVFAAAEIAVVSIRRTRLAQLVEEARRGASTLHELRANPERFLATVQVGITVVGTTAAAFGGASLAVHLEPVLRAFPWIGDDANEFALAIVVVLVSFLTLVFGELVPKSLALRVGEPYALLVARPLQLLGFAVRPVIWLLTTSSNLVLRPFSDRTDFLESRISTAEIQQIVGEAAESGAIHAHTREIASRALEFDKLLLRDVMVPRNRVDLLSIRATQERVRRFISEERRSRIPIYEGTRDNVTGYVSAKDISALVLEGKPIVLPDILRPVSTFPESTRAIEVLRFMHRERIRFAIVVDEHGGLAGIVTFEDLVEEIVGEVVSEHEDRDDPIRRVADGTIVVRGDVPLRDINRELGIELVETDGATTIGGLCSALAVGVPRRGARLAAYGGIVLVVEDATTRAVRKVRILLPPAAGESVQGSPSQPPGPRG